MPQGRVPGTVPVPVPGAPKYTSEYIYNTAMMAVGLNTYVLHVHVRTASTKDLVPPEDEKLPEGGWDISGLMYSGRYSVQS